jgi:acyl-coenzyme A thioesterase PaaI-like protein
MQLTASLHKPAVRALPTRRAASVARLPARVSQVRPKIRIKRTRATRGGRCSRTRGKCLPQAGRRSVVVKAEPETQVDVEKIVADLSEKVCN